MDFSTVMYKEIYVTIYDLSEKLYGKLFGMLNYTVTETGEKLLLPLENWNEGAFHMVRMVAEQVILPIGAIFIVFVLIARMVQIMNEGVIDNAGKAVLFLKFIMFLYLWRYSFDIMNRVYAIGLEAGFKVSRLFRNLFRNEIVFDVQEQFQMILDINPQIYDMGILIRAILVLLCMCISYIVTLSFAVTIYYTIIVWFIEIIVQLSVAPIPISFFALEETKDIAQQYIKKIMAMGFRPFFAIMILGLYGVFLPSVGQGESGLSAVLWTIAGSVVFNILLIRAGSFAKGVFDVSSWY